jgi:hypothetical protein
VGGQVVGVDWTVVGVTFSKKKREKDALISNCTLILLVLTGLDNNIFCFQVKNSGV